MTYTIADLPCILFAPGHKPDLFAKAIASGAPAIVIDLEDAVAPERKDEARALVRVWFTRRCSEPTRIGVRFNHPSTRFGLRDMTAFFDDGPLPDFIVLPKVESALEPHLVHKLSGGVPLICTIESAIGVSRAFEIAAAAPSIAALGFGGADLASDLRASMEWEPLAAARSTVVQAAAAAGVGALDVPWLELDDDSGLEAECRRARAFGFTGKFAIHPRFVERTMDCFMPSETETEHARGALAAAVAAGGAAVAYRGKMIDEAILRSARRIVALDAARRQST